MNDRRLPTLTLVEERASIGKRREVAGKVRVRTETESIEQIVEDVLERESVEVTRVPVNAVVDAAPPVRTEGDVTIFSVVKEELVVVKRLVLVEEVRLRRSVVHESVEIPVSLRRQRAVVERIEPETGATLPKEDQSEEERS